MPDPKSKLKGVLSIGGAIDERVAQQTRRMVLQPDTGAALPVPLSGGGSPGGGAGGGEPIVPDSLWKRSATALIVPACADDDVRLDDGSQLSWDDGAGSSDVALARGAADRLDLADGDGLRLHEWLEAEEIAVPSTPPTGFARRFTKAGPLSGSRESMLDDTGSEHDLCAQHKQTFWIAQDLKAPGACNVNWQSGAAPGADGGAVGVIYSNSGTFGVPAAAGDPAPLMESCGQWSWTGTQGLYKAQAYVTLGAPARLFAGDGASAACQTARLSVRLKVNRRDRFAAIKLILSDVNGTNQSVYTIQTSRSATNITADNAWQEFTAGPVDIASFTAPLRLSVTAHGTLESGYLGLCELSAEYLALELWAR